MEDTQVLQKQVKSLLPEVIRVQEFIKADDFDFGYMIQEKHWVAEFFKGGKPMDIQIQADNETMFRFFLAQFK
ncbi:MAG: hypothetical protein GY920_03855 [Aliivibrio sp.]|nr:hypothetical protein [Aliivibrio sp.]MCP4322287.1 hypothetical protein [Alteromonadales bacterium]